MYNPVQIYERIESVLKSRGISIRQFEIDVGLNRGTLGNMKKGSMPSVDKIADIADGLKVSIDFLLDRNESGSDLCIANSASKLSDQEIMILEKYAALPKCDRDAFMKAIIKLSYEISSDTN